MAYASKTPTTLALCSRARGHLRRKRCTAGVVAGLALLLVGVNLSGPFLFIASTGKPLHLSGRRADLYARRVLTAERTELDQSLTDSEASPPEKLEQWLRDAGQDVDYRTAQALRDIDPRQAFILLEGLERTFERSQNRKPVDDDLKLGKKFHGVIRQILKEGASVNIGLKQDGVIPSTELLGEGAQAGDEIDVWVQAIWKDGTAKVTPVAPRVNVDSIIVGQKFNAIVLKFPDFGGAFVDMGLAQEVYIPNKDLKKGLKIGDKLDVWVQEIENTGKITATSTAMKLDFGSLELGQKLHAVVHELPDFGGALVDVGGFQDAYIPKKNLVEGTQIGEEMDVWVQRISEDGTVKVSPTETMAEADSQMIGEKLRGLILNFLDSGDAVVKIGAGKEGFISAVYLPEGVKLLEELDVWVQDVNSDGTLALTPRAPKVDSAFFVVGQKLHGAILSLPGFGGAFVDVGALSAVYIPAKDLPEGSKVGEEVDVWVQEIKEDGRVNVSPRPIMVGSESLTIGQKLHGVIVSVPDFGGAFVDIGTDKNGYIRAASLAEGAKTGEELDVWVQQVKSDGQVVLTPRAPKIDIASLVGGQKLPGVIIALPRFGGAFVDIGAVQNGYIVPNELIAGVKIGDEIDVWLKHIREDKLTVTPLEPKVDIGSLVVGQEIRGVIVRFPPFGGAFVDVGATSNVYILDAYLVDGAKAGDEITVQVDHIRDDGKVQVKPVALELNVS